MKASYSLKDKCGVYSIFNKINNKQYIGSSKDLYSRFSDHLHNLRYKCSHNAHLQAAWNKYGEDAFEFRIIEFCSLEDQFIREQHFITLLAPEYNFALKVLANVGRRMSDEQKRKISETLKHKYKTGQLLSYVRTDESYDIYIYNIKTFKLEKVCHSVTEAGKFLNCCRDSISKKKIKGRIYCNKYILLLEYISDENTIKNYFYKNFMTAVSPLPFVKYIVTYSNTESFVYHRTFASCGRYVGCSDQCLRLHLDATIENPYAIKNSNYFFFVTNEYIPIGRVAVPIEQSSELLSDKIGEYPTLDNTEII